ncbi:MAG: hypothetical protein IKS39_06200, partial [Clostridia bacterium]|nr:hypothetical protein [Clostridia bacterium]
MIKRLVSLLMCLAVVSALTSCGTKEMSQNTGEVSPENEASEIGTVEELTDNTMEKTTEETTEETTTEKQTTKSTKIYLDATDEEIKKLVDFYYDMAIYSFWEEGFNRGKSSFAYDLPVVMSLIHNLYGEQWFYVDGNDEFPGSFRGVVDYNYKDTRDGIITDSRERAFTKYRSVIDPLSQFTGVNNDSEYLKWYEYCFYSIDAKTLEWVESELLGGTYDRNNLIKADGPDIRCYYYNGRYYFMDEGGRGGTGYVFKAAGSERDSEGRYILSIAEHPMDNDGNPLSKIN